MGELLGVYIYGETKTGKGAAGAQIAKTLQEEGFKIYYGVAGDFYRRYVAIARLKLGLSEEDELPTDRNLLAKIASEIYDENLAYEPNEQLGDLQRPAISRSVAKLGELPLVQKAGGEWFEMSTARARDTKADIIVIDGRNPRGRMRSSGVPTALDLFLTCEEREAARRVLLGKGIEQPTVEQIEAERQQVVAARERDRSRAVRPFLAPTVSVEFSPRHDGSPKDAIERSWETRQDAELPLTITLDNTNITESDMLTAVSELAIESVRYYNEINTR